MNKIYNIIIIFSFVGLWLTSFISNDIEVVLGFILIFSFGILHGSNDILLINSMNTEEKKHSYSKVLMLYLLFVFTGVVIFYFIPLIALLCFILFSAFHFGEQHWEYELSSVNKILKWLFYLIYGLLVLFLLFVFNIKDVSEVVMLISNYRFKETVLVFLTSCIGITFFIMLAVLALKKANLKGSLLRELFFLLIFTIIFKVSTLIWGFAIYFILWHSIPSLYEQITFVYNEFTFRNLMLYCRKAFPYWLVSIIGIIIVHYFFKDEKLFYAIFFSLIAAVTFPHTIIINKLFSNKKRNYF